jgi:hypothetical protein
VVGKTTECKAAYTEAARKLIYRQVVAEMFRFCLQDQGNHDVRFDLGFQLLVTEGVHRQEKDVA